MTYSLLMERELIDWELLTWKTILLKLTFRAFGKWRKILFSLPVETWGVNLMRNKLICSTWNKINLKLLNYLNGHQYLSRLLHSCKGTSSWGKSASTVGEKYTTSNTFTTFWRDVPEWTLILRSTQTVIRYTTIIHPVCYSMDKRNKKSFSKRCGCTKRRTFTWHFCWRSTKILMMTYSWTLLNYSSDYHCIDFL